VNARIKLLPGLGKGVLFLPILMTAIVAPDESAIERFSWR